MITLKSPREVEIMGRAGRIVAGTLARMRQVLRPGMSTEELRPWLKAHWPQIRSQLDAGFVMTGFYEDRHTDFIVAEYIPTYLATRAVRPPRRRARRRRSRTAWLRWRS